MGHGSVDHRVAEQHEQAALQSRVDLGFNRDFLAGRALQLRLESALLGRRQRAPAFDGDPHDAPGCVGERIEHVRDVRQDILPVLVDQEVQEIGEGFPRASVKDFVEQRFLQLARNARLAHQRPEVLLGQVGLLERVQELLGLLGAPLGIGHLEERRGVALGQRLLVHVFFTVSSWVRYVSTIFSWIGSFMVVCTRCSAASSVRPVTSWRSSRTALSRSIRISFFTLAKAACTWASASKSSWAFVFSASASEASRRRWDSWLILASLSCISASRFAVSRVSWSIFRNVSSIS